MYPEDIPRALQVMRGAKETGKDAVIEARIVTRAGKIKILMEMKSYQFQKINIKTLYTCVII